MQLEVDLASRQWQSRREPGRRRYQRCRDVWCRWVTPLLLQHHWQLVEEVQATALANLDPPLRVLPWVCCVNMACAAFSRATHRPCCETSRSPPSTFLSLPTSTEWYVKLMKFRIFLVPIAWNTGRILQFSSLCFLWLCLIKRQSLLLCDDWWWNVQGKTEEGEQPAFYFTLLSGIAAGSIGCFVVTPLDGKKFRLSPVVTCLKCDARAIELWLRTRRYIYCDLSNVVVLLYFSC